MERTKDDYTEKQKRGMGPPKTFREHLFHTLPQYSGPYSVGTIEVEVPARDPRTFSHIKRNHVHILRMDTVLFSIYYPCDSSSPSSSGKKPSRATWLPRPRVKTCRGYAKFLNVPHLPVTGYIAATTMFTKLPAFRNAKLSGTYPNPGVVGSSRTGGSEETLRPDVPEKPRFPIVMFSHGLGGSRTCYSAVCGEMASNGFIVVAVEHRDGSGARSFVNLPPNAKHPGSKSSNTTDSDTSYKVDYIFPEDNAQDTSPNNARGVDTELRNAQIEMRIAELEEAHHILGMINEGDGAMVGEANLRRKGNVGSSSKGLESIDWADWEGRLHLEKVTAMGHSFGAATTVQITRQQERFPWVGQGILLDAWGPATPILGEATHEPLRKPILAINSEAFMHWPANFERMANICKEARSHNAPCWMFTIKGSTHLSQTDFAVLYPQWMSLLMKTVVNPRRAVYLTINSSLEFLNKVLPAEHALGNVWPDEGILSTEPLGISGDLPEGFKPTEKWVAARLRIPNEFWLRVKGWFQRRPKPSEVATDIEGNPLTGIVNFKPGSEVWVHCRPDTKETSVPVPTAEDAESTSGLRKRI